MENTSTTLPVLTTEFPSTPVPSGSNKKTSGLSTGAIIAIIVVVLVVCAACIYLFGKSNLSSFEIMSILGSFNF